MAYKCRRLFVVLFFFNDTATTEIYTLSLHDALPIFPWNHLGYAIADWPFLVQGARSEEHTSELQSRLHLVCRLLLEKKKTPPSQRAPAACGTRAAEVKVRAGLALACVRGAGATLAPPRTLAMRVSFFFFF